MMDDYVYRRANIRVFFSRATLISIAIIITEFFNGPNGVLFALRFGKHCTVAHDSVSA